jgi:L-rhamnose 1-dehydrogenase
MADAALAMQDHRTALVTGTSRGIGAAVAVSLASDGCAIGINYLSDRAAAGSVAAEVVEAGGTAALMRSLAIVLGPHGITCNAILPSPITTDANRDDLQQPDKVEYFERRIPVGRIGDVGDVGDVVRLLVRDEARYINAAEIVVDGGLRINLQ